MTALASVCLALGVCLQPNFLQFRTYSEHATRIEVCLFTKPQGQVESGCYLLQPRPSSIWSVTLPLSLLVQPVLYYGYRVWGPNWNYNARWSRGTDFGFLSDVDSSGNRFNPNKLLLDPYALEVSHGLESIVDLGVFSTGSPRRDEDSGPQAPKGVITTAAVSTARRNKPQRALKDDVIYEVHVVGLTANDPSVPVFYRGTYKGAAFKAAYLKALGVTAVEFLPVQQAVSTQQDYWGYMPLAYFAPQREYAFDKSPGGPVREFQAMVDAFHQFGLKVYIDVVYNHTGEGGPSAMQTTTASILSYRGLDNAVYYNLASPPSYYEDHTGCGNDLAAQREPVRTLIMDSLFYWKDVMGVDGFRFDLATMLGNVNATGNFHFNGLDPRSVLQRALHELPVRPAHGGVGVDLIAEPWAIGAGTYQQGGFPNGWAEWNGGIFRDPLRLFFNKRGVFPVSLEQVTNALAGSAILMQWNGRKPWHSINFITAHDGFTLRDLFSYNVKQNNQPFPYGPSDGGTDENLSWDQNGDPAQQRQLVRTALLNLILAAGTPMLAGGDEFFRTVNGNNNPYNLNTVGNYLPWPQYSANVGLARYVQGLLGFRAAHAGARPAEFYSGRDGNANGVKDLTWYASSGQELVAQDFAGDSGFVSYRVDNSEFEVSNVRSFLVATNAEFQGTSLVLPPPAAGFAWYRVADSASWFEDQGNISPVGQEQRIDMNYWVNARSGILLIEKSIP